MDSNSIFRDANSVDGAPTVFIEFVVNRVLCTMCTNWKRTENKWPRGSVESTRWLFTFARQSHARQICIYVSRQVIKGFFNNVSQRRENGLDVERRVILRYLGREWKKTFVRISRLRFFFGSPESCTSKKSDFFFRIRFFFQLSRILLYGEEKWILSINKLGRIG